MKILLIGLLLTYSAMAGTILVADGFTSSPDQGIVSPILGGATSITFSSFTDSAPTCAGTDAALCSAAAVSVSSLVFTSGVAETFYFGLLSYTTSGPWEVEAFGNSFLISTLGNYTAAGYTNTPGSLNLTFQPPPVGNIYTLSASGITQGELRTVVSEPSVLGMVCAGLGLILLAKRRIA